MGIGRFKSTLLVGTALVLVSTVVTSHAQDATAQSSDATVLERIVVTGKGKRVNPAVSATTDTPLASQTTAEEIRKKDITNLRDLGNTTEPGVDFIESKPGRPGGVFIRGLGGARVTTLIDDIPVPFLENFPRTGSSSPTTGVGDSSNSFDFSSLSTIDIVRGADSSRIGAGALAGAIVLRTLEPEDVIQEGKDWGVIVKSGYDSSDESWNGSIAAAKRVENTSILFQGGYKRGHETDNGGTRDVIGNTRTAPNPADTDQTNLLFKIRQDLAGGHKIGLTAERFNIDTDSDLKSIQSLTGTTTYRVGDYWGIEDTRRERVSFDYQYEAPEQGGLIDAAKLTAYWQRLSKESGSFGTRNNGTAYVRNNALQESSYGLTGGTVSTFETGNLDHTVRIGGNLQFFDVDQYLYSLTGAVSTPSQADLPLVKGTRFGLYAEDEIAFGDSGFKLTPGLRFDWYDYNPKDTSAFSDNSGFPAFGLPDGQDGARLSPKLLATYQITPQVELFAQWSMAYRAPTVNELYVNFTNSTPGGDYTVIGNPNLKPETGHGFEIGANYDAGDLTGKVTVFHNLYSNFIDTTFDSTNPAFPLGYNSWQNLDKVQISGIEVNARKEFANGVFVNASLSYAYGKDKDTDQYIRSVAPFKSIVGVGYDKETWGTELTGIFAAGMRDDGLANTFDAPGYGIFNLTAWFEPEQLNGLRIQAGLYNIFDRTYYNAVGVRNINPGSTSAINQPVEFYSEAGRAFKVSITKTF